MSSNKFPHTVKPLNSEANDKIKSSFLGLGEGSVKIGPKKFVLGHKYGQVADTIYNFKVRPDDVWVVTFPRSGTTLLQEMIWLILNEDYDTARKVSIFKRFPFLEISALRADYVVEEIKRDLANDPQMLENYIKSLKPEWEILDDLPGRRYIKSHLPLSLLPPALLTSGAKVVYVARNPKNVAISRYHQDRSVRLTHYVGDFQTYWDFFENSLTHFTPYWEHLEEGWQRRYDKNFLFLFYEDITKDYKQAIVQVAIFLGKPMGDEQISKLVSYLDIDNFRKNYELLPAPILKFLSVQEMYQHVRTGKSGDWKEYFTKELEARANKWIEENYKNTTLRFPIKLY